MSVHCRSFIVFVVKQLIVHTSRQGLFDITSEIQAVVAGSGIREGLCSMLVQHTSASLTIQENADPSARRDLEAWLNRLVPEYDELYTHTQEGADDMPAHIKAALTTTSLSIPVVDGSMALGTWQGIYLWEHRHSGGNRRIVLYIGQ